MASRSTRNRSRNLQRTPSPSPTPPVQASPRGTARKSMGSPRVRTRQSVPVRTPSPTPPVQASTKVTARKSTGSPRGRTRQSAPVSTPASTSATSQPTSQARTALRNGGGPSTKKRVRRVRSSSSDSSVGNTQNTTARLFQGQSSSDSEDVGSSTKKKKQTQKRTQRDDSNSEGSDIDFVPPSRDTAKSNRSISAPSGSRPVSSTSSLNHSGQAKAQFFGSKGGPSTQAGYLKNLINKCVFYILVADQKKHAIKKADILKNVFEEQNAKENYLIVLKETNKILKKTFGLEMLAHKNQKNSYILINILDPDHGIREFADYSEVELQKRGLIFLLLTIIFMNENAIPEDKLWKALESLGINPSSSIPHPVFGNVKRYLTSELVKEMYLEYIRVNNDPVQYEFQWGERAYQEVQKKDLLEFACNMMGDDTKPEDWKLQFIDAKPKPSNAEA